MNSIELFRRKSKAAANFVLISFCAGLAGRGTADAAIVHRIYESSGQVISALSGAANLESLTIDPRFTLSQPRLNPASGQFVTGDPDGPDGVDHYAGLSGPGRIADAPGASFIVGGSVPRPLTGTGPLVGVFGSSGQVAVPRGYISGSALSASSAWASDTLSGLPIAPATYV